jgi:hypothetical protein
MPVGLTKDRINYFLHILHSRLPEPPTAVKDLYELPPHLKSAAVDRFHPYTDSSLQAIADHIGFFLGIIASVKVTIGIETSDYMMGTVAAIREAGDRTGFFRVKTGLRREIQITKKHRFELETVLAVLAHESTHNYLFHHGIHLPDENENELLTDMACTYLGLGHILLAGYTPITWTSDHWREGDRSGHTRHTVSVGYVTPPTVYQAILYSAELRGWPSSSLVALLPVSYRCGALVRLLPYQYRSWRRRRRQVRAGRARPRAERELESVDATIEALQREVAQLAGARERILATLRAAAMTTTEAATTVALANDLATGQTERDLASVRRAVTRVRHDSTIAPAQVAAVAKDVLVLSDRANEWKLLLRRYLGE